MPIRSVVKAKPSTKPKKTYRPRLFRERDVRRAISSAQKMGLPVSGYTVGPDGRISVMIGAPASDQTNTDQTNNPWDAVLKEEKA
jgi:hypothetical protein